VRIQLPVRIGAIFLFCSPSLSSLSSLSTTPQPTFNDALEKQFDAPKNGLLIQMNTSKASKGGVVPSGLSEGVKRLDDMGPGMRDGISWRSSERHPDFHKPSRFVQSALQ